MGRHPFPGAPAFVATHRTRQEVGRQLLEAGLIDEVHLHLVPLPMGGGTPLFAGNRAELIPVGKPVAGSVTHLRYRVRKRP